MLVAATLALVSPAAPGRAQSDPAALEAAAIRAFEEGNTEDAIAYYRRASAALEEPSEVIRVALLVALLEHDRGRDNAAINTLAEALALDVRYRLPPERYDQDFERLFRTARDRAVISRQNRALKLVESASEDIRAGRFDLARNALDRALVLAPDTPSALYNLAYLDLRAGHEDAALAGFERLIARSASPDGDPISDPLRAQALTNLGYLYARRQQHAEAADALEEAVSLAPQMASAWLNLGLERQALGAAASARQAFERAHALDPEDPAAIRYLAEARIKDGDHQGAAALLEDALAHAPSGADLWYTLARAQAGLGHDPGPAYASALQADPDDHRGFGALAAFQLARRACDAADATSCDAYATRALALRPGWVEALMIRARARRTLGDLAGAQDALELATRTDPTRADAFNNLGNIYCLSHERERAEKAFQRAVQIDPSLAVARDNLAMVRAGGCPPGPVRSHPEQ